MWRRSKANSIGPLQEPLVIDRTGFALRNAALCFHQRCLLHRTEQDRATQFQRCCGGQYGTIFAALHSLISLKTWGEVALGPAVRALPILISISALGSANACLFEAARCCMVGAQYGYLPEIFGCIQTQRLTPIPGVVLQASILDHTEEMSLSCCRAFWQWPSVF